MKDRKTLTGRPGAPIMRTASIATPPSKERPKSASLSRTAPAFRIFGGVFLALSGILGILGISATAKGSPALPLFIAAASLLFWALLILALAEALTRLAEIAATLKARRDLP